MGNTIGKIKYIYIFRKGWLKCLVFIVIYTSLVTLFNTVQVNDCNVGCLPIYGDLTE